MNKSTLIISMLILSFLLPPAAESVEGHIHDSKCGTFHQHNGTSISFNFSRPEMDYSILSESGNFRIHFDIEGKHAVNTTDIDQNGIPDFVDSAAYFFDYSYKMEVEEFGYLSPIPDRGGPGDEYDVYLLELGNEDGWYGVTVSEIEILPRLHHPRYNTFIVIDNDFSEKDSIDLHGSKLQTFYTFGYEALKITAAHEFHHAVQFMYGMPSLSSMTMAEMTSTFMEYRLYPEIKDYFQYMKRLFDASWAYPFGRNSSWVGYTHTIFARYLYENYGDEIIKDLWINIGLGDSGYEALDNALIERGCSLADAWCKFMPWVYYTGDRAKDGKYFDDAAEFPEFRFKSDRILNSPVFLEGGETQPFEMRGIRLLIRQNDQKDDTINVFIANTDLQAAISQSDRRSGYTMRLDPRNFDNSFKLAGTDYHYHFLSHSGMNVDSIFLTPGALIPGSTFPNPYARDQHDNLYFPAPEEAEPGDLLKLTIYSVDMRKVVSIELPAVSFMNRFTLEYHVDKARLRAGIYFYSVEGRTGRNFGKFAVR
ncbi:MAG: MXAN_6640 family putative metalloprotease [Bacteroidota bacterium]